MVPSPRGRRLARVLGPLLAQGHAHDALPLGLRHLELAHPEAMTQGHPHADVADMYRSTGRPIWNDPGGHQQKVIPSPLSSRSRPARASSSGSICMGGPSGGRATGLSVAAGAFSGGGNASQIRWIKKSTARTAAKHANPPFTRGRHPAGCFTGTLRVRVQSGRGDRSRDSTVCRCVAVDAGLG